MEEVWRITDRLGREVSLTQDRLEHILTNHPDIAPWLDELQEVVAQAEVVTQDRVFIHRLRHYRAVTGSRSLMRVVVHYRPTPAGWVGLVITAHRYSAPNLEEQIWP